MKEITKYSIRKCSDVNLESLYYEILDENENILFDISVDASNSIHILFYHDCVEKSISINLLRNIVNEVEKLISE